MSRREELLRQLQLAEQRAAAKRQASPAPTQDDSFRQLQATSLYCPTCRRAMPVRERMLLVLSDGDMTDYLCTGCGESLGTRRGS